MVQRDIGVCKMISLRNIILFTCLVSFGFINLCGDDKSDYLALMSQRADITVKGKVVDENGNLIYGANGTVTHKIFNPKTMTTFMKSVENIIDGDFLFKYEDITSLTIKVEKEGYHPGEYKIDYEELYKEKEKEVNDKVKDGKMSAPKSMKEKASLYGRLKRAKDNIKITLRAKSQFTSGASSLRAKANAGIKKSKVMTRLEVSPSKVSAIDVIKVDALECPIELTTIGGIHLKVIGCDIAIDSPNGDEFNPPHDGYVSSVDLGKIKYDAKSYLWIKSNSNGMMIRVNIAMFFVNRDNTSAKITFASPVII